MNSPFRFTFYILPLALIFSACVPVDQLPPGSVPGMPAPAVGSTTFGPLDDGNTSITSIHFTLKGYNEGDLRAISNMAEDIYSKIGNDTGLYSFLASGNYAIVVYKDQNEYDQKTHQPAWSHTVSFETTMYTYAGQTDLAPYMAHELVHLIFNAYMPDRLQNFRWLEEGVAMYEEVSKMPDADKSAFSSSLSSQLHSGKMSFSQMTFFTPNTEELRRTDIWYQQTYSVVNFLLTQGGSALTFAAYMNDVKNIGDADRALADSYPGKFRSMNDLENAWKLTV